MSSLHRSSDGENGGLSLAVMHCAWAGRRLLRSVWWRVLDLLLLVGDLDGAEGDLLLRLCSCRLVEGASDGVGREPVGEVESMASMSYRGLAAKTFLRYAACEGVHHARGCVLFGSRTEGGQGVGVRRCGMASQGGRGCRAFLPYGLLRKLNQVVKRTT